MKQLFNAPWFPAAAPFLVYVAFTSAEGLLPKTLFVLMYCLKLVATGTVIAATRRVARRQGRFYGEQPTARDLGIAAASGIVLGLTWIAIDHFTPHFAILGSRVGYDPNTSIGNPALRLCFYVVRFTGLVLIVPYVEELFYRGLLLRLATHPEDWNASSVGKFSASALAINIGLFAASHPEWLAAGIFAAAMCGLTRISRSVVPPMISHAVTNLVLGIIIVHTGNWSYW